MAAALHQSIVASIVTDPNIKPFGHASATGGIILAWLGILTPVLTALATLMAILWYGVTLYESKTVQDFLARLKAKKILGPKVVAQADAKINLAVAKEAVKTADALPDPAQK